ncbi:MAG: PLP-dependent aminotransferase family protein [Treponema phagedenis]|uniref:MocR-like pyridoxine biosynthesis transcription factor PdxR n=1 Tax=Treponema phagedenis TaxID=162 RepID=UPI0031341F12
MKKPLYVELYEEFKEKIQEGTLPAGSKLPSKRSLARERVISINSVENAYNLLIDEGYVESQERRGYFVANLDLLLSVPAANESAEEKKPVDFCFDFSYQGVGDFPFGIWKKLTGEVLSKEKKSLLFRGQRQGDEALRASIVEYLYHSRGIRGKKENIIISAGTEYLFQILFGLWENAHFGIEDPGFERWSMMFEANRISYVPLPMDTEGIHRKDVEAAGITVLCITPSHQFPTGKIMSMRRRLELLDWAKQKHAWIIEDDYDGEFKYQGRPIPALKSIDVHDKVVYMGTFSNTLSPSFRLSYMLLPDEMTEQYHKKAAYAFCPVPILIQKTLDLFIRRGYFIRHVNRMRKLYKEKRETLLYAVQKHAHMRVEGSEAGLHTLLEWEGEKGEEELVRLARNAGILIHGISNYCIAVKPERPTVILGFAGLSHENIAAGIDALAKAWE